MIYWDIKQRSEAWFQLRLGCVTSSRLDDMLAKTKDPKRESERCKGYFHELLGERLSGNICNHDVPRFVMQRLETEPLARTEYELRTGRMVREIGLATHPAIYYFAASTDGLVGDDGVLEIKCHDKKHHTQILLDKEIPKEYLNQMWGELSCTDRQWCDFVSYCPDMPPHLQLYVQRLDRDPGLIRGIESEVIHFLDKLEKAFQSVEHDYESTQFNQWVQTA